MSLGLSSIGSNASKLARCILKPSFMYQCSANKLRPCILAVRYTNNFHTTAASWEDDDDNFDVNYPTAKTIDRKRFEIKNWKSHNDIVYPPRLEGELRRPAEVFYVKEQLKYPWKKMWYIACMVRGLSIDEALKQCHFYPRRGGAIIKDSLLEAQEQAITDHNVEFKSNLWIVDSFVSKAKSQKGTRKHGNGRFSTIELQFCNYFLCLREGTPPPVYYAPTWPSGHEQMHDHLKMLRDKRIFGSL